MAPGTPKIARRTLKLRTPYAPAILFFRRDHINRPAHHEGFTNENIPFIMFLSSEPAKHRRNSYALQKRT